MSILTPSKWEWSATDLKTDIVFNSVRIPSFTLHALYGAGLPVESASRPMRRVVLVFMVIQ